VPAPVIHALPADCSSADCRVRVAAAFTLVEALLAVSLAAIAGSVLLMGITSSLQTSTAALEQTIAEGMAQQLMDEVVGGRYHAEDADAYQTTFTASAEELLGPGRSQYDDIDDYHGIRNQPPKDPWGIALGRDNGTGGDRHPAFMAPAGTFDDWRQEVDVFYVAQANLTTPLAAGQTSDYRLVVVRIMLVDPERGDRVLAEHQRVVAYVPPL
jgi:type II secretory pathway pseudopilin PulG